jgi:DnaJ-class molecular chaperone
VQPLTITSSFTSDGESLINEGLIQFLTNALAKDRAERPVIRATVNVPNFVQSEDILQAQARETMMKDIARCLGNLAVYVPQAVPQAIERNALQLLKGISEQSRDRDTIQFTARAITNFSALGK